METTLREQKLIELIGELQWVDLREHDPSVTKHYVFCPVCGAVKVDGHRPWCKIYATVPLFE